MNPQEVFLANLSTIERIIRSTCSEHALYGDEAEDFGSWVKLRLIDNDYAVIRKFQAKSSLTTYLVTVIGHLFLDYRTQKWGRWRPSATARRLGPVAVRLETLIYRDGMPARQAVEVIRSASGVNLSEPEISRIATRLPVRTNRPKATEMSEQYAAADTTDDGVLLAESERTREQVKAALARAITSLEPEDQIILRLNYWEELSVAEIARTLHIEQKPLYRRLQALYSRLREALENMGVKREEVLELIRGEVV